MAASDPLHHLACRLEARLDELVERMLERVWSNPALERWARDDTREPAADIARGAMAREVRALKEWELPRSCPEEDLAVARAAVAFGAPVVVPLHCYRAGQSALSEAWLEEVDRLQLPGEQRTGLLRDGARFMNDYVDRCAAWVELEYERERERVIRSEEQRRMNAVRDLLEGGAPAEPLDYDLGATHLALIAWGRWPGEAVSDASSRLRAPMLAVSADPRTAWAWIATLEELPAGWEPPSGTRVAIGGPADGVDGFGRAHRAARDAQRVAAYRSQPVLRYRDVALEALACADERRAAEFVCDELDGLLGGGSRETRLLATLEAYFAHAHNASSAAARLGVSERTVANRLRAVEDRLGRRAVQDRRAELETALRLHRLFATG